MSNLAFGKIPEEPGWVNSSIITSGDPLRYDAAKGYGHAAWPSTYTLDLTSEYPIKLIQFLLWDGLGDGGSTGASNPPSSRIYQFVLKTSIDGKEWQTHYNTGKNDGYNGWQIFIFKNKIQARYVRLDALFCSSQPNFHIVRFQVHDDLPPELFSRNARTIMLPIKDDSIHIEERTKEFARAVNEQRKEVSELVSGINKTKVDLEKTLENYRIIGESLKFHGEADKNQKNAKKWRNYLVISLGLLLVIICLIMFCAHEEFLELGNLAFSPDYGQLNSHPIIDKILYLQIIRTVLVKALLISILIYITSFCAKNYSAEMHNYTVNMHKANSLTALTRLVPLIKENGDVVGKTIEKSLEIIFAHQKSGFTGKGPDIVDASKFGQGLKA